MKIDGSCHCGAITYEAEIDPDAIGLCHCTDCQTLSGSPFRASAPAASSSFRLLTGAPTIYVKTAESGNKRAQAFCPICGTPIYSAAPSDTQIYMLRIGAIVQRQSLRPRKQIWCRSALPWSTNIDALPGVAKDS